MAVWQSCNQKSSCWGLWGWFWPDEMPSTPPDSFYWRKYVELGQQELGNAATGAFRKDHKETEEGRWLEKNPLSIILHSFQHLENECFQCCGRYSLHLHCNFRALRRHTVEVWTWVWLKSDSQLYCYSTSPLRAFQVPEWLMSVFWSAVCG